MLDVLVAISILVALCEAVDLTSGFTVGEAYQPPVVAEASPNIYTDNVLTLQRGNASSFSSSFLHGIRKGADANGIYSRVTVRQAP